MSSDSEMFRFSLDAGDVTCVLDTQSTRVEKLRGPTSWRIGNWNRYETGDLKGICLRDAVQDLGCFFGLFLVFLWDGQESLLRLRI